MAVTKVSPTKGNLLNSKKSLQLAKMGYDLMDRNIIISRIKMLRLRSIRS
jgi:V/A-type H+-transporting ATPase subunit D